MKDILQKRPDNLVETFKNIITVAVHCWYIKVALAEFCQQIFEQNISEGLLEKIDKKLLTKLTKNSM